MKRPSTALLGAALVAGAATVAATLTGAVGAGAATATCTAYGTLPTQVALTSRDVVVRPVLRGTAGCRAGSFDNGATATLRGPGGSVYDQRWAHFGSAERIDFYPTLTKPGRYVLTDGDVQVYDAGAIRIPSSWQATSTLVRFGATFTSVSTRSGVSAKLRRYGSNGWYAPAHVTVALEHRVGSQWRTVARTRTASNGAVHFGKRVNSGYRIVSAGTTSTFSASHSLR